MFWASNKTCNCIVVHFQITNWNIDEYSKPSCVYVLQMTFGVTERKLNADICKAAINPLNPMENC